LRLGIKIGPDKGHLRDEWRIKLDSGLNIRCTEVYFDLDCLGEYAPMFAWLRAHGIRGRLHSSTFLPGGIVPNLATADPSIRAASARLFRRTVDVAACAGMEAVIFHPGSYQAQQIVQGQNRLIGDKTPQLLGNQILSEGALRLAAHGRECGVKVLLENLPACDFVSHEPKDRSRVICPGFVPHDVLVALGESGIELCVDVGHLLAEMVAHHADLADSWAYTVQATHRLAPYTCHLHLSTNTWPFNGVDSHDGFLPGDYARGAAPTLAQIAHWLRLFAGRDIWAVPEPDGGADVHLKNYCVLRELMPDRLPGPDEPGSDGS